MSAPSKPATPDGSKSERDEVTGQNTTGHVWDGIRELDRPLPRWWLLTFYATIVFALGYMVLYPAIPLLRSATPGLLGYSSRLNVEAAIAAARGAQANNLQRVAALSLEDIRRDETLSRFAISGGRSAFAINCSPCHGSGAAGSSGYPNLNDDDWLWGGDLAAIETTIRHGIRFAADTETRSSSMPAFGADGILSPVEIAALAETVLSLSGQPHDLAAARTGAALFVDNCAPCHGERGEGNREFGAPALADAISLYGKDRAAILAQITHPRHGVMPAWGGKLDAVTIKQLALYVHALGGGETKTAAPTASR